MDSHHNPSIVRVHLRCAKTDPFDKGVSIHVGKTGTSLCPVSALLNFMAVRPPGEGPLFVYEDSSPLTRSRFVQLTKHALHLANVEASGYSGHSCRIKAATAAAAAGVPQHTLSRCLGGGRVMPTTPTSAPQESLWLQCTNSWPDSSLIMIP